MAETPASSFRERAEAVSGSIWRCLRRFGVPESDVEDCFQSVLIQLHERWDRLEKLPVGELRSYAACVAIGVARGAARRRARAHRVAGDLTDHLVAEGTPEIHAQQREALEQLDAILQTMSEERREVFVLYELEGLTGSEIAEHLGLPMGTAASRLRRAREDFEAAAQRIQSNARRARG